MNKVYIERLPPAEPQPDATAVAASVPGPQSPIPDPLCVEFLLRCLSVRSPATPDSPLSIPNWPEVLAIVARHGLTPLLYTCLKQSDAQALVPADVWERLRRIYVASAVRSIRLYRELQLVLRCLRGSGIKVIVLKGAFLAEAVYEDAALRSMADVDLMVPRASLPRAHAVLLDASRAPEQPNNAELSFGNDRTRGLSVGGGTDLCWTFDVPGGRSRLDTAGLWNRARPATIAGVEVLALSPEDLLLHLCLHAAHRHGLSDGLRPLCDVTETTRRFRDEMDWAQVTGRARDWGAARYVGLTLYLARSMLGAGVPDAVLEHLVPGGIDPRILEAARESVLARTGYMERMPFFGRLGAKSFGEKAKLSWERVSPSRDEMAARYPASRDSKLFWLYYALRLRDVIRTYWSHTFRRGRVMVQSCGRDRNAALVNWLKSSKS